MTVPMNGRSTAEVQLSAVGKPDDFPAQFEITGEELLGGVVFGPAIAQFGGNGIKRRITFPVTVPKRVKQIPQIVWFCRDFKGNGEKKSFAITTSPIYVILDKPQPPQKNPRVDVIDYAVKALANNTDLSDVGVCRSLTQWIYAGSRFSYDKFGEDHHTKNPASDKDGQRMQFTVSNFIEFADNAVDPLGSCRDFSNLFQVCGAAVGLKFSEVRRVDGPFIRKKIWPVGYSSPVVVPDSIDYHQVGWATQNGRVFDPTYRLESNGFFFLPVNMDQADYQDNLHDRGRSPSEWNWQRPVRPLEVK